LEGLSGGDVLRKIGAVPAAVLPFGTSVVTYGPLIFAKGNWLRQIKKEESALALVSRQAGIEHSFRGDEYGGYNVDAVNNYVELGFP
jgi:hypothetical protein